MDGEIRIKAGNKLAVWICISAITIITFLVFSPSLGNGFTNWDDGEYVINNHLVVSNSIPIAKIFESPVAGNYHPLTMLSLALNYHYGGLNPFGYHLFNVIFHLLNTILVFFFIFLLTRRNLLMAVIVSLFFGIHPMHVESVAWVSERKDVLYVFFFLAGLIIYLHYIETKKAIWYILTLVLFIFSCLSKGMGVVFPMVLLLIDYLRNIKFNIKNLLEKLPFFIFSIALGIIAVKVQKTAVINLKTISLFQRVLFSSYSFVMYIIKFFVPFKLSAFYPYPSANSDPATHIMFYSSPAIAIAIIGLIIYLFTKKEKEIVFALLFYFNTVMMVLQFISVGYAIMADRYSYLSYVGLLFGVAYIINKVWESKERLLVILKYPIAIIAGIVALTFSYQAYCANEVWNSSKTLWTNTINNYPDFSIPYYMRGLTFSDNNKDSAIDDYTRALQLDPDFEDAYNNRGVIYMNNGKSDLAIADFNKVLQLNPYKRDAYYNLGLLYAGSNKPEFAIVDFTKTISLDSTYADAYNNRGLMYLNSGKYDLSIADFNKSIILNPSSSYYYYNRGLYYNTIGQYEKAVNDFAFGLQLRPQNEDIYFNMEGVAMVNLMKYNEAIKDFSKAIEINPLGAGYWLNRAVAESKLGQNENAKADIKRGQQLSEK